MMAALRPNVYLDISGYQKSLNSACGLRDLERVLCSGIARAVAAAVRGDNALSDFPPARLNMVLCWNIERILAQDCMSSCVEPSTGVTALSSMITKHSAALSGP